MSATKVLPWDKILPDQAFNRELFDESSGDFYRSLYETIAAVSGVKSPAEEFKLDLTDKFTIEEMASSPVSLVFLQLLIALGGARRILEIGTFIGVSAMYMARALPAEGQVVTIEKFDHFAEIARRNFAQNGLAQKIRLINGDAFVEMAKLPRTEPFDLVFIDGNKERYADYFEMAQPLVRVGGMVIVDDAIFHGDALNTAPRGAKGAGVRRMLDVAVSAENYRRALLPICNGMLLMLRQR